jgi:hypothetical protein
MMVRVDQAGHDQAATSVNRPIRPVLVGRELSDIDDVVALDENAAIFDKAVIFIERDEVSVGDQ